MPSLNLRKLAKGRECQVRIIGICNWNSETTVLAHYRLNTGLGIKPYDLLGAWACSSCHDAIDGRTQLISREEARLAHAEGVLRTQEILIKEGII